MDNVYCSVVINSRGRVKTLKHCIYWIYSLAKFKDNLEIIVRLDDDDEKSIALFTDPYFKQMKNLIVYKGARVGFDNLWILFKEMFKMARGSIVIPMADDCMFKVKDWDEFYYTNFKDRAVVAGSKARFALTRKVMDEHEFIRNFSGGMMSGDVKIFYYAMKHNIFIPAKRLYKRYSTNDKTNKEGSYGGWKLKDPTVLDNLEWIKING